MTLRTSKENVGILGYGEVGQAIAKCYSLARWRTKIKDLNRDDGLTGSDILHVCIPWSNRFLDITVQEIRALKPGLVIIHSTVAPGTTKKLVKMLPGYNIVHSPIRGVHPNLFEGIKTFIKFIGSQDKKAALAAQRHFKKLGIKTKITIPAVNTELGKLLDTTYYGLVIAFHGEAKDMCEKVGADFDIVMTAFNTSYNEGYKKLKKTNVIRPVLKAPEGGIGGHCILPNVEILQQFFKSPAFDLIQRYTPQKK